LNLGTDSKTDKKGDKVEDDRKPRFINTKRQPSTTPTTETAQKPTTTTTTTTTLTPPAAQAEIKKEAVWRFFASKQGID